MATAKRLSGPPGSPPEPNLEAEQSVLGAILLRPDTLEQVADILLPVDFYREGHARIFKAMLDLRDRGRPVDMVTVTADLKEKGELEGVGGTVFVSDLSEHVGTAANAGHYAKLVYDAATKRRLWQTCQELLADCGRARDVPELLDRAEARVFSLSRTYLDGEVRTLGTILDAEMGRLKSLGARVQAGGLSGVDTGLEDLNALTFGWQKGDMIVLGGRPGHGKTALGLNFAYTAAKNVAPSAFFSLEMTEGQLAQRLLSLAGGVSGDALRSGRLSAEDIVALERAMGELNDLPLYIIEGDKSIMEIKSMCRRIKAQAGGLGLVVVDYLQMIRPVNPGRSRYEEISAISRSTKALAKELLIPVLVNAQLNRKLEERKDKRPIMSDLRDSGEIEQDADCIMFTYRDELYNENSRNRGLAEILVRKQRSGRTGSFMLVFQADESRFLDHYQGEVPF